MAEGLSKSSKTWVGRRFKDGPVGAPINNQEGHYSNAGGLSSG
jgi:hypothetical protein